MLEFIETTTGEKTTFINGGSPFKDLVTFTVTGYGFVKAMDGTTEVSRHPLPILKTSIGNLFLSMLTKRKVDKDGKILTPSGSFNRDYQKLLKDNPTADDSAIFSKIMEMTKDKTLICKRVSYVARGEHGDYPAEMVEINYKG